ncbi:MAG: hypothetical protein IKK79_04885 [Spirochaetaceae bacterium]|nr:hypothetical protein [Spirochaetaceae bacterium]
MAFCASDDMNMTSTGFLHCHASYQGTIHGDWTPTNGATSSFLLLSILAVAVWAALDGAVLLIIYLR